MRPPPDLAPWGHAPLGYDGVEVGHPSARNDTRVMGHLPILTLHGVDMYAVRCDQSFRATSGPVIRLRSGNVEAMIASDAASPPKTVAQYAIPGVLNAMPTWEWR